MIDIPNVCEQCSCFQYEGQYSRYCGVDGQDLIGIDWGSEKPYWCPIRPIPERACHENYCDGGRYDKGWNECLDELLKDGG